MLEKMSDFFNSRADIYDEHQFTCIDNAHEFFLYTSTILPQAPKCKVLDLGCGTGIELEYYFKINPTAQITGIDISTKMLDILRKKFTNKKIKLIEKSYFDVAFKDNYFDAVVSVESLHHFYEDKKLELYTRINDSLKEDGYFVLTDYFVTNEIKQMLRKEYELTLKYQNLPLDTYHFDIPNTVRNEMQVLRKAGFKKVKCLKSWGNTSCIIAYK